MLSFEGGSWCSQLQATQEGRASALALQHHQLRSVEYHSMSRLKNHLLRSNSCRITLHGRQFCVQPEPGAGSVVDQERSLRYDGILPPLQGEGPVLPVEHSVDPGLEDRTFIEETCLTLVETDGPASCEQLIREVVRRFPISWACCRQSLPSWKRRSRTKMFQFWLVIDKIFVRFFLSCSALNLGLFFMILAFSQRGLPWI